jgi:hypothetical protein
VDDLVHALPPCVLTAATPDSNCALLARCVRALARKIDRSGIGANATSLAVGNNASISARVSSSVAN